MTEEHDQPPEDVSRLTDENVEWCCEYYFRELCKRDEGAAWEFWWTNLGNIIETTKSPKSYRGTPHARSA